MRQTALSARGAEPTGALQHRSEELRLGAQNPAWKGLHPIGWPMSLSDTLTPTSVELPGGLDDVISLMRCPALIIGEATLGIGQNHLQLRHTALHKFRPVLEWHQHLKART